MPPVKAAICHEFGTDLTLETIELRAPVKGQPWTGAIEQLLRRQLFVRSFGGAQYADKDGAFGPTTHCGPGQYLCL